MAEIFTNPFVKSGRHSVIDRHAYPGGQPQGIDEARMHDTSDPLLQMDAATPPTKPIPWQEFPRCVYKHPTRPYKKIQHFNVHQELIREEMVPAEHQVRIVKDAQELELALKQGWKKEPFIAAPLPDVNDDLYPADFDIESVNALATADARALRAVQPTASNPAAIPPRNIADCDTLPTGEDALHGEYDPKTGKSKRK